MRKIRELVATGIVAVRRIDGSIAASTGPGSGFDRSVSELGRRTGASIGRVWASIAGAVPLESPIRRPVAEGARGVGDWIGRALRTASRGDDVVSLIIAAAFVAVGGWILVTALWDALAFLPRFVNGVVSSLTPKTCAAFGRPGLVSDTLCGAVIGTLTVLGAVVSMLLAALFRMPIRRVLETAFGWLPREAAFLGPPLVATALFTMGWAGIQYHFRERPGLVADGLFPVVVGLAVLVLARAWPVVTREGSLIAWRERLAPRVRWLVVAGVPIVLAVAGTPLLAAPVRDQVVALAALAVGFAMLAPAAPAPTRSAR